MEIKNNLSFGAKSILKTLWVNGQLPTVTRGFYGEKLSRGNVTLDHLVIFAKSGRSDLSNLVLCSRGKNHARGMKALWKFASIAAAKAYLAQFVGVEIPGKFYGNRYISMITKRLFDNGLDIKQGVINAPVGYFFKK